MGFDFTVRFDDPAWYVAHRGEVLAFARSLPGSVPVHEIRGPGTWKPTEHEVWLKDPEATDDPEEWPYDVRLFIADELAVEVTIFNQAYFSDLRALLRWLQDRTAAILVDDDGNALSSPP